MEEELRCPSCKELFNNPVLLPCYHALCLNCAVYLQTSASGQEPVAEEVDKLSILSETDSGVVCTSRPNSYVGTPNIQGIIFPPLSSSALSLACPVCSKLVYFDENGAHNLPKYRTMQNIVLKYGETKELTPKCELCPKDPAKSATVLCEQCEVLYCDECRENCHPARGALAKHVLLAPSKNSEVKTRQLSRELVCSDHTEENLSFYCMLCKLPVCSTCRDTRHNNHDVQAVNTMCKAQKTELSQNLQQLSEKARSTTELIQRLKSMSERITDNSIEFEEHVIEQVDVLISALETRKRQLIEYVRQEKDGKVRALKDQVALCTSKLQHTTSLIQFCIEALKETDSVAFLQVGSMLISRVANEDIAWCQDHALASPRVSPYYDLTLDTKPLIRSIEQLNFIQMKPPNSPTIIAEECSAENNSVTVAWQPPPTSYVEGYVLELDDGNGGEFREVYCGKETICTVDGLHFNSMYNARVKAFNSSGEGEYSEVIGLQTAEVAWFTFDPCMGGPDLSYSEDNCSVSCEGYEHRVALGSVGFSRGVHYWEFTIDRYDADTDPSFGIARVDVAKDQMLGKDDKGWSMYIDRQRSWFMHANMHDFRCEGGIEQGSTIGVLLDLNRHQISFYVNEEPHGPIAFHNLYGVFYPAVSLNRGVSVTLHTALEIPQELEDT